MGIFLAIIAVVILIIVFIDVVYKEKFTAQLQMSLTLFAITVLITAFSIQLRENRIKKIEQQNSEECEVLLETVQRTQTLVDYLIWQKRCE